MMKRFGFFCLFCLALGQILSSRPQEGQIVSGTAYVPETKYVALTFDDGPRRDTTTRLLDELRQRGVHATFFVIGCQISGNEDLLKTMQADGHQIGNHTFSHCCLEEAADAVIVEEVHKTEVLLTEILGADTYWLRPPYGLIDQRQRQLVPCPMLYWSVDPKDWEILDAKKVADTVLQEVESGDVVLLHDFYPTSVEAALMIVDSLAAEGYQFLTVEELFSHYGTSAKQGVLYANALDTISW